MSASRFVAVSGFAFRLYLRSDCMNARLQFLPIHCLNAFSTNVWYVSLVTGRSLDAFEARLFTVVHVDDDVIAVIRW